MTALGFALLLLGAMLVVGEAHAPGGVLGVAGGVALMAGGIIALTAAGGGAATIAVPVGVGLGAAAGGWALFTTRTAAGSRHVRIQAGAEALCGRIGVVRRWSASGGQFFRDGALWPPPHEWGHAEDEPLREGDHVVVERVSGLTLSVRRAEEWELQA
jgi:membrane-bound ClpP family serine protease